MRGFVSPNSSVFLETYNYTGTEASGILYSHLIDWSGGNSQLQIFAPAAGINQADLNYTGADAAGMLQSALFDLSSGQSVIKFLNPSSTILSEVDTYSGPEQTGVLVGRITDLTTAGSQIQLNNPLSGVEIFNVGSLDRAFDGNVVEEDQHFSGYDGSGNWLYTTANFGSPSLDGAMSAINFYHYGFDSLGTSVNTYQTAYYSGINGTGIKLTTVDMGSSPIPPYESVVNPQKGVAFVTLNTSGFVPNPTANETLQALSNHIDFLTGYSF